MKSRVRQKLNSRRGASFLLALLFFLIFVITLVQLRLGRTKWEY